MSPCATIFSSDLLKYQMTPKDYKKLPSSLFLFWVMLHRLYIPRKCWLPLVHSNHRFMFERPDEVIRILTKEDIDISHWDFYFRQIGQVSIVLFHSCKVVGFVTDIKVWVTAEVSSSPAVSVSLGPSLAVIILVFMSDSPWIPATHHRFFTIRLRKAGQKFVHKRYRVNCKKPLLRVESIEEPPALFWDKVPPNSCLFRVFEESECKSLLSFLVHPFTLHTLFDLQSFIKFEVKQQKQSLNFFSVSYLLITPSCLNFIHIQILWSPSFNG